MEEVKRDLMRNLDIDARDDISVASACNTNNDEESCMAGEAPNRRLMPAIHHISLVEHIYGLARDRAAALHTITSDSNSIVEKAKIDPRTNIVQQENIFKKNFLMENEIGFKPGSLILILKRI
ncbi:hypothetical protein H5410_050614 [Solanum commersonii]|uniref:Uncharacterized protein n=1 Tax=Solanum commersonii TaxID=4109 RepID=A0A9J5WVZ4_SOLCO|nr:hypothetical protein H5410_050614 [Solanum commersonii]